MAQSEAKKKVKAVKAKTDALKQRREKVAQALLRLSQFQDGIAGEDPPLDEEAKRDLYELADGVIQLWDALNG